MQPKVSRQNYHWQLVRLLVTKGPQSARSVCDELGCTKDTSSRLLDEAHKAQAAHIEAWEKRQAAGPWAARYAIGPGKDAPYPEPKPNAQVCRDWRQNKKVREGAVRLGVWGL